MNAVPKLSIDKQISYPTKESHILSLSIINNKKTTFWLDHSEFFFLEKYKKLSFNTWIDYRIL